MSGQGSLSALLGMLFVETWELSPSKLRLRLRPHLSVFMAEQRPMKRKTNIQMNWVAQRVTVVA